MRCCVPFCQNTSDNISKSEAEGISFHGFPSKMHLRATWLKALGKQDNLPDTAVVCSKHFLNDDIYETESGLRQIRTRAIPSMVQVCMICLDTDSKLLLMNKYNLYEAYEKLTGYPLCDQGNLKQTLCVQCAQRLTNFSRFREKSLRARALMMDLINKHELITRRHIEMINSTKHQLKSNMVVTTLGPDHCNLYILEHPSEDNQTELEETGYQVLVKTEGSDDSMSVDEDTGVINEDHNIADTVKDEFVTCNDENISDYSIMMEEKAMDEDLYKALKMKQAYMRHTSAENSDDDGECETSQVCKSHTAVSSSSSHSSLLTENKQAGPSPSAHSAQTLVAPLPATSNEIKAPSTEEADTTASCRYERLTDCFVKLYDIFSKKVIPSEENTVRSSVSQNIQNEVPTTEYVEPGNETVKVIVSKTVQSEADCLKNVVNVQSSSQNSSHTEVSRFICDICRKVCIRKRNLVKHIKTHTEVRWINCKMCQYTCKCQSVLKQHMRTHTGIKPSSCKICDYKCAQNSDLVAHMRTHTGEKPYSCKVCDYKCAQNSDLVAHMRTHTGIKPLSCELCNYKCAKKSNLVTHMRIHTGEKPYSCKVCDYKCARNAHLVTHMRTHTGIKPFSCELCSYKCAQNSNLVTHMRTHTGIKPFLCKLCSYKCAQNSNLVTHMRTHTGDKPYSCKICDYKGVQNSDLVAHMRTHTGIKPISCELCSYKCAQNSHLVTHMRTHTGDKPYSCNICDYKGVQNSDLVAHMRTHTGIKPISCELCSYKCAQNSHLVTHMRTHTGEKPYSCKVCDYKCARNAHLVMHMRTHTGIKPFLCELCSYKCAQSSHLVAHMRTHTGIKPFSCQLCSYKCARNNHLVRHMRTHTVISHIPVDRLEATSSKLDGV
ncbi:zinc finger and SCAN domain-containing protein 2-like isoform X3 [Maniola jurtina]|uniref:zinc finger and SCAN domain-containing protein 2-like isoform X3 n=1 Tax=Maniola jurtina TaxID=191418 RepID=UPI001E689BDF|nr:zinc finger and SCAN domain-containing protein 2-like isoform X3 [Maniola jurtina]